jgi:hypothetical protein
MPDEGHVHEPAPVAAPVVAGAAPVGATPIALPTPGRGVSAAHILGLSKTIGNAAVARAMASGALLARDPAPRAAARGTAARSAAAAGVTAARGTAARSAAAPGGAAARGAAPLGAATLARDPAPGGTAAPPSPAPAGAAPATGPGAAAPGAAAPGPAGAAPTPPVAGAPELSQAPFANLLGVVEGWSPREEWLQAHLATPGVDGKRLNLADTIVMRKETGVDEAGVIEIAQELYVVGTPVADRDAVFTYLGFGGLALPSNIEAFAAASASAGAAIATMTSFEERAGAVQAVINQRLTAAGVPTVGPIREEGGGNAHFDKKSWSISVDPDFAMRGGPDAPAQLLSTVYHEARHAEQDFLVARALARTKSAEEIAAAHDVPPHIATAAKANPLPENDPQNALVERLQAPVDTTPDPELAKIRDRLIEKKNKGEPYTPEEQRIMDNAYARYKGRPPEADAFLVEALAKQGQTLR